MKVSARAFAIASACATTLVGGAARADPLRGHASGTATVGENWVQTDAGDTTGTGPFFALTPSVGATYEQPRIDQALDYTFTLNVQLNPDFSTNAGLITYAHRFAYENHVYVSPTVDFLSGVTLTEAPLNTLATGAAPSTTVVAAAPAFGENLQGSAVAGFLEALSETTRLTESGTFTVSVPLDVTPAQPRTYGGQLGVVLEHDLGERDTGSLTLGDTLAHFTSGTSPLTEKPVNAFNQNLTNAVLSWRHDYTADLSSKLDAGVVTSIVPGESGSLFVQPTGAASIDWSRPTYAIDLTYEHAATLDVFLADIQLVDLVALKVSAPIALQRDFVASATASFERTRAIATDGSLVDPFNVWLVDAGVGWSPHSLPELLLGARVNVTRQEPLGALALTEVAYTRETLAFSVTYGYPSAATPEPPYLSPTFRPAPLSGRDVDDAITHLAPHKPAGEDQPDDAPPAAPAP
ncbi:MAG TPA: hypothetical protein VGM56_33130 [Byssovorax sp.]|jgi:hypothetical protein